MAASQGLLLRKAACALTAGVLLVGVAPSFAQAAPRLSVGLSVLSDGTEAWDADDSPGNDSGPANGIVRVNDTITYEVNYAVNEEVGENATFVVTLPKGVYIENLPGYCLEGSSLLPERIPTAQVPLGANSIDAMPEQTITCNMGRKENATDKAPLVARVSNLVHHSSSLTPSSVSFKVDNAQPVEATGLPTVKASSRLKWDLSKNSIALRPDSGYVYGPANEPCLWNKELVCKTTGYTALISAPAYGKGAMPAIGDITFVDDLSPEALYPQLSPAQLAEMKANLEAYGSRIFPYDYFHSAPGPKIGGNYTEVNSVRDSGAVKIEQEGPGKPATFTISGADTTLVTYPKEVAAPAGAAIPAGQAYAVSVSFRVQTPVDTIVKFGEAASNTWTLATRNQFKELSISGFEPTDKQTSAEQPADNDYRSTTPSVTLGYGFSKAFVGVPGTERNVEPARFNPSYADLGEGPPGGATFNSGGITVAPTQDVVSQLLIVGSDPALPGDASAVMCDAWDNTRLHLHARNYPGSTHPAANMQRIGSNGKAVWVSGYNNALVNGSTAYATAADQVPEIRVQYAALPGGSGEASQCGDAQGPWFDSPEQVPGNDAAKVAEGVYTGVGRVRVFTVLPKPVANTSMVGQGVRMTVGIGMKVADAGRETGDILPNWASHKRINRKKATQEEVLAHVDPWTTSTYNPATHAGASGDRLILALAQVRVEKTVRRGNTGDFTKTPPQVTGGNVVQYRLSPTLTSPALTTGILKDVWVEDCLPISQQYSEASLRPQVVLPGSTPADAKREKCAEGETYIRWVLPKHEVNKPIEPIILSVEVSSTVRDGVYDNVVEVWAEDDASSVAQRQDRAQIQVANIAGVKLEKLALTPVVQVNYDEKKETNRWLVRMTNTLPPAQAQSVANPQIIDVLPKQGERGTSYKGRLEFVSAKVTKGGDDVAVQYTKAQALHQDPQDASNGADGATAWCDAPAGGNRVSGTGECPVTAAEVTGLRVSRPGPFVTGEVIEFEIDMVGIENATGDVYANTAFARAQGLQFPVGPITRPERVIGGAIGDYTWVDVNRNGLQDEFEGRPEPVAAGVEVVLTGTDDLGNAVRRVTTSNDSGQYRFDNLRSSDERGYVVTFGEYAQSRTSKGTADSDPAKDSNADTTTGAADPVVLHAGDEDLTIDAGYRATGQLTVTKIVAGQGAGTISSDDEFAFNVHCTLDGATVYNDEVKLTMEKGRERATSEPIKDLPVGSVCVVTETKAGKSDPRAGQNSVTTKIEWDAANKSGGQANVAITNLYSAGVLKVSKKLAGDQEAVEAAKSKEFVVDVTCQLPGVAGAAPATVFGGRVSLTGEETKTVVDASGSPVKLPLGSRCFGTETVTGGAQEAKVDFDSFDNAAVVAPATADQLAELTITATNTFRNPAKVTMEKKLVSVEQTGESAVALYDIVVRNEGSLPTVYDLSDGFNFGAGVQIKSARVVSVDPADVKALAGFDGVANTQLVQGQSIAGGATHVFRIEAKAAVSATVTSAAADCELSATENGTGLLNRARLAWNNEELTSEACGPVTPPASPKPDPTPSVTPKPDPTPTPPPVRPGLPKTGC